MMRGIQWSGHCEVLTRPIPEIPASGFAVLPCSPYGFPSPAVSFRSGGGNSSGNRRCHAYKKDADTVDDSNTDQKQHPAVQYWSKIEKERKIEQERKLRATAAVLATAQHVEDGSLHCAQGARSADLGRLGEVPAQYHFAIAGSYAEPRSPRQLAGVKLKSSRTDRLARLDAQQRQKRSMAQRPRY
mmetsp:Transcript_57994/g.138076  ORF Transcript_57994/g.138076 Transcript_57994/m.138076 type:complete len:186 (+) Transcript_57994:97-654(+)